jgi:hypothetical protein
LQNPGYLQKSGFVERADKGVMVLGDNA